MLNTSIGIAAAPKEDIEIIVDGETVHPEVPQRIIEERTIVPQEMFLNPLELKWSGMMIKKVDMPIDSTEATVNGETENA